MAWACVPIGSFPCSPGQEGALWGIRTAGPRRSVGGVAGASFWSAALGAALLAGRACGIGPAGAAVAPPVRADSHRTDPSHRADSRRIDSRPAASVRGDPDAARRRLRPRRRPGRCGPAGGIARVILPVLVLSLIGLGAAVVIALWWRSTPRPTDTGALLTAAGDVLGLLAGYGFVVLVALMARLPPLEKGIGTDRLARWHAMGGRYVITSWSPPTSR